MDENTMKAHRNDNKDVLKVLLRKRSQFISELDEHDTRIS